MDARGQGLCKGGVRRGLGVPRLGAERGVVSAALAQQSYNECYNECYTRLVV
jgi:hypothetical protein